ncbi:MAG: hypothetical protein ACK40M_05895 [Flavobacteriales bacterium]
MNRIVTFLFRNESLVLFSVSLLFASSFFFLGHFVTIDGPAHVYNAELIAGKLFGSNPLVDSYYSWNNDFVPNWLGHFLLLVFKLFLSGSTAEKLLLSLYLLGIVFSLRYLIQSFNPANGLLALLSIPFVFNTFLYYGFYNFCLSLIFIFWISGFVVRNIEKWTLKRCFQLSILLLLSFFAHLSGFIIVGIFLFAFVLFRLLQKLFTRSPFFLNEVRSSLFITIACLPSLSLFLIYWLSHHNDGALTYKSTGEIFDYFISGTPLIAYGQSEVIWTGKLVLLLAGGVFGVLIYRSIRRKFFDKSDFLLLIGLVVIALSFLLPDSDSRGGYMTLRLVLISFLFLVAWLGTQKMQRILQLSLISAFLILSVLHIRMRLGSQRVLNEIANEIDQASKFVNEGSIILPVHRPADWDWLTAHMSNYICADKSCVVLENYEAPQDYFPLRYSENHPQNVVYSYSKETYCSEVISKLNSGVFSVQYLLEFGTDLSFEYPCESVFKDYSDSLFKPIYSGKFVKLHQLK